MLIDLMVRYTMRLIVQIVAWYRLRLVVAVGLRGLRVTPTVFRRGLESWVHRCCRPPIGLVSHSPPGSPASLSEPCDMDCVCLFDYMIITHVMNT